MTEIELKNQVDYWEKIYFSRISKDDRELYLKVYTGLKEIYDIWTRENQFDKE